MPTWNLFDDAVSTMRTRLRKVWSVLGKYAGCPSKASNYKQQALVELARRLELEQELKTYRNLACAVGGLLDSKGDRGAQFDRDLEYVEHCLKKCDAPSEESDDEMAHENATIYFPDGAFDPRVGWDYVSWYRDEAGKLFCVAYSTDQVRDQVEKYRYFSPFVPLCNTAMVHDVLTGGYYSRP